MSVIDSLSVNFIKSFYELCYIVLTKFNGQNSDNLYQLITAVVLTSTIYLLVIFCLLHKRSQKYSYEGPSKVSKSMSRNKGLIAPNASELKFAHVDHIDAGMVVENFELEGGSLPPGTPTILRARSRT